MSETINEIQPLRDGSNPTPNPVLIRGAARTRAGTYLGRVSNSDELLVAQQLIEQAAARGVTVTLEMLGIRLSESEFVIPLQTPPLA